MVEYIETRTVFGFFMDSLVKWWVFFVCLVYNAISRLPSSYEWNDDRNSENFKLISLKGSWNYTILPYLENTCNHFIVQKRFTICTGFIFPCSTCNLCGQLFTVRIKCKLEKNLIFLQSLHLSLFSSMRIRVLPQSTHIWIARLTVRLKLISPVQNIHQRADSKLQLYHKHHNQYFLKSSAGVLYFP